MARYVVTLTPVEREALLRLVRVGKGAARKLAHARILLKADVASGQLPATDKEIAAALEVSDDTVARVRRRFVEDAFVCCMEDVLETYHLPYDPEFPVVCMDEASKQLVSETRSIIPAQPGQLEIFDYEYERQGLGNRFMFVEPLAGRRHVIVTARRTRLDWAHAIKDLVDVRYPHARKIRLVMDNLNTHGPASLYEAFEPAEARRLWERAKRVGEACGLAVHHGGCAN